MNSKRVPGQKAGDGAAGGDGRAANDGVGGLDGRVGKDGGAGAAGRIEKEASADEGRQPEGAADSSDRVIHNGSAGAFEAAEDGRYEEDSDEDNDDLAMGH